VVIFGKAKDFELWNYEYILNIFHSDYIFVKKKSMFSNFLVSVPLFMCGLFNDTVSISEYVVLNAVVAGA
jgi:hypothetical protein